MSKDQNDTTSYTAKCGNFLSEIASLDTVTDFLIELGMKPHMHLVEISIFSLNNVTVRPTKIMNRADKNWAHFFENKVF